MGTGSAFWLDGNLKFGITRPCITDPAVFSSVASVASETQRSTLIHYCMVSHPSHPLTFWATVCKTVHPILSDHCVSVLSCLSCLSVTLVYCCQTDGWTKMKLGMQVGLGPGHIVLDGDPASPKKGHSPQFSAHVRCGQMAAWIKMPLGMEAGLSPGDFVLDGDKAPPQKKRNTAPPIYGPCLL